MAAQASPGPPTDAPRQGPKLVTATRHVSQGPSYLFMCTNNVKWDQNESLFRAADGSLVYRLENKNGVFKESKVLYDAAGNTVLTAKKFPLSLAKWTVTLPSGAVAAKTRTISGLAKYGVEVDVPGAPRNGSASTFTIVPELSNSKVIIMQNNGKGKDESLVCVAQYGENVAMGMISAAVQDWSYHIGLEPGADTALACCLLVIYTELIEWNALGGAFGMN